MNKLMYFIVYCSFFLSTIDNIVPVYVFVAWQGLLLISLSMLMLISTRKQNSNKNINTTSKFMVIWLVYSLCSLLWSGEDLIFFLPSFRMLVMGTVATIVFNNLFQTKNKLIAIFRILSISVLFHNLIGWIEFLTGKYLFVSDEYRDLYTALRLPTSTFYNTNDFATFLSMSTFFLCLLLLLVIKNKFEKLYYMLLITSSILLLFISGSRGNLLGLMIGGCILILYNFLLKKMSYKKLFFMFSVLSIVILIWFIWLNTNLAVSTTSLSNETSDTIRINLIKNGFHFFIEYNGLGVGIGNIEYLMENAFIYPTFGIHLMHNWWMEILVSSGIIIFGMYIYQYIRMYLCAIKNFFSSDNNVTKNINLVFIAFLISFVFSAISTSSLFTRGWFWMLHALMYATYLFIRKEKNNL